MKKTYADECLERAEKATPGPWKRDKVKDLNDISIWSERKFVANLCELNDEMKYALAFDLQRESDAEFILHARTDVPALARRLNVAINAIISAANHIQHVDVGDSAYQFKTYLHGIVDLLRTPLEEK